LIKERAMEYICDDCGTECDVLADGVCGSCYQTDPDPELPTLSGTWFYPQKFMNTTISG